MFPIPILIPLLCMYFDSFTERCGLAVETSVNPNSNLEEGLVQLIKELNISKDTVDAEVMKSIVYCGLHSSMLHQEALTTTAAGRKYHHSLSLRCVSILSISAVGSLASYVTHVQRGCIETLAMLSNADTVFALRRMNHGHVGSIPVSADESSSGSVMIEEMTPK